MAFRLTIYIVITYFYIKILLAYTYVGVDHLCFVFRTFGFIKPIAAPLCYFLSPFLAPTSISLLSPNHYLQSPSSTLCPA